MGNLKRTQASCAIRRGVLDKLGMQDDHIPSGEVVPHQRLKQVSKASIDDLSLVIGLWVIRRRKLTLGPKHAPQCPLEVARESDVAV